MKKDVEELRNLIADLEDKLAKTPASEERQAHFLRSNITGLKFKLSRMTGNGPVVLPEPKITKVGN